MAGGENPEAQGGGGADKPGMTRRDFARVGALAGGLLWTAPRITTINFAQKIVGSGGNTGGSTTTTEGTPPTTGGEVTSSSTSSSTSSTSTSTPPTSVAGETSTSTTTVPVTSGGGTSTTTVPVTSGGGTSTTSTTECKPGNGFGDKNHCHTGPPGQVDVGGQSASDPNSGGKGPLAFTGADSLELAVAGAAAIVAGRALYGYAHRAEKNDAAQDASCDETPPPEE